MEDKIQYIVVMCDGSALAAVNYFTNLNAAREDASDQIDDFQDVYVCKIVGRSNRTMQYDDK
jgi:hypothetical protein